MTMELLRLQISYLKMQIDTIIEEEVKKLIPNKAMMLEFFD